MNDVIFGWTRPAGPPNKMSSYLNFFILKQASVHGSPAGIQGGVSSASLLLKSQQQQQQANSASSALNSSQVFDDYPFSASADEDFNFLSSLAHEPLDRLSPPLT